MLLWNLFWNYSIGSHCFVYVPCCRKNRLTVFQLIIWAFQNQKLYLVTIVKGRKLSLPKLLVCNSIFKLDKLWDCTFSCSWGWEWLLSVEDQPICDPLHNTDANNFSFNCELIIICIFFKKKIPNYFKTIIFILAKSY